VCRRFYAAFTANTLTKEALEGFGGSKLGGQVVYTLLVLLAKEEVVLQRLTEIGKCCGKEMNVKKFKMMRI